MAEALAAGIQGIVRLVRPEKWWGRVCSDYVDWGVGNRTVGACSPQDISKLEIQVGDEVNSSFKIFQKDGSVIRMSNADIYSGQGLEKFIVALDDYGYFYTIMNAWR